MEMCNFFSGDVDDDLDNDDFDEFLFQSIQRYNTLQMFNLENTPQHLLQLESDCLCVASKRAKGSSELVKLKIPRKLTLPPEEEGLCKENDFKVLSGIYIDKPIYQIGKLQGDDMVLTSETDTTGVHIYKFTERLLDNKNKIRTLDCIEWTNPDFTLMKGTLNLICSKCCHQPIIQVDASNGKRTKDIKHPLNSVNEYSQEKTDQCTFNNIKCSALNENLVTVLSSHSGDVFLHDLRTKDSFSSLPKVSNSLATETWTLSGCRFPEVSPEYFGILSDTTSFCIYDIRKNEILFQRRGKNPRVENHANMKLKFSEKERKFSISGMNSFVEIFSINENDFELIFTHEGHCPSNAPSVFVTDHIWLQSGNKEYVVSICDNKTLNCWN